MKQASYLSRFARYSLLSVLGTLGVSCYILADTFFISNGIGTDGLAALNISIPIYNFIYGIGLMFGMGGATKFSICKSLHDTQKTDSIYTNTVYLSLVFGLLFSLAGFLFSRPLASLLGANAEILDMTNTYLRWLMLFAPAFIMNNVLVCFVRNDDNPLIVTIAMLVGSFSNIILDYIFIFPMNLGIFGAVFATAASPLISMAVMSLHWIKRKNTFHMAKCRLQRDIVRQDISLGFPSLISQVAFGVVMIIFNMLILNLEGNVGVAAYGVIANISLVVISIYTGIAQGVQPLISESYGSGDKKHIKLGLRYALLTITVLSAVIYFIIFAFATPITAAFNSEGNARLYDIAVPGLKLYFSSVFFIGFNTVLATFFTSVEKTIPAHVLSLLRGLILIVPMAFLLSALWGMTGIWLTYLITEGIVAVLGCIFYFALNSMTTLNKSPSR